VGRGKKKREKRREKGPESLLSGKKGRIRGVPDLPEETGPRQRGGKKKRGGIAFLRVREGGKGEKDQLW